MYIISACLMGINCKYNGGNNENEAVKKFAEHHSAVLVCPETEGGLTAPREPAERSGDRVMSRSGKDWTEYFQGGAREAYRRASAQAAEAGEHLEGAVLKARSPYCGFRRIYDGTFTGNCTDGNGCFAQLLTEHHIPVATEEDLEKKPEVKEK